MTERIEAMLQTPALTIGVIYLLLISCIAAAAAIADKRKAIHGQWRIPERTLLLLGLAGGAAAMYLTMCLIHHKTRHLKFMIGLPLEIIVQIGLFVMLFFKLSQ